ncbi:hypothetical protein CHUAL_001868 [Chamberlinius hualienensis]
MMSFNCFQLILISIFLVHFNFNGKCSAKPHHRHHKHHRNWVVAALPTDNEYDDDFQSVVNDFVNRVEPELGIEDTVFDLNTVTTSSPRAITTTTRKQLEGVKVSAHPYMKTLYEEIDEKRNEQWAEMTARGAIVRGIEPIKVTSSEINDSIALDFSIGTINDLDAIHHVDLVLTSSYDSDEDNDDDEKEFSVHILDENKTSTSTKLIAYRKFTSSENSRSFLILEMTPTIRNWWSKGHLSATQTIHISPSTVHLQQPILVFYYVSNIKSESVTRKKRSYSRAFGSSRTNARPCSNRCVHAQRRQANVNTVSQNTYRFCTLRSWDVTLQDLQWEAKVVAPDSLQMNYCSGACEAPIYDPSYNATNHAVVRSVLLMQTNNRNATDSFPPPYCVPTSLETHTFMFSENGQFYIKQMDNIIAKKCGCR